MFRGLSLSCCVLAAAGPGPAGARGQPVNMNGPGPSQTPENIQQMKKLMEQELKSDKYKSNGNKGYVFTLMPLYAVGVGMFAAYKFLKVNEEMSNTPKRNFVRQSLQIRLCFSIHRLGLQMIRHKRTVWLKGQKSQLRQVCVCHTAVFTVCTSVFSLFKRVWIPCEWCPFSCLCVCICTENQLNELEQRLAQTERMLNSILTQLDPLTNWWVTCDVVCRCGTTRGIVVMLCVNNRVCSEYLFKKFIRKSNRYVQRNLAWISVYVCRTLVTQLIK